MYKYGCTGTHVQVYKYEIQVRMYRYTGTRYKYAIQIQMYRYVCTGRTNSTHKNWSQQYTQKLTTKVHTKIGHESTHIFATEKYKTRKSIDEYRRQK